MFDDSRIKDIFEEVEVLKTITRSMKSIVFGGAIRDCDTGRDIRDIDLLANIDMFHSVVSDLLDNGWVLSDAAHEARIIVGSSGLRSSNNSYTNINSSLVKVVRARKDDCEFELDILFINCTKEEYLRMLPISTSMVQAFMSTTGVRVFRSDDYLDSLEMRQITISDNNISIDYIAKMATYYPDWNIAVDDCIDDGVFIDRLMGRSSNTHRPQAALQF